MIVFSASRTSAADEYRSCGVFSRHRKITLSNSAGVSGQHSLNEIGIGILNRANTLKLIAIRPRKRMPSAHQLIQNNAQRPHIALHAALPGHKLLRRHIRDGAASRRVGLPSGPRTRRRLPWVELRILNRQPPRQTKVEDLHQSPIGQHHVCRLQVAMKDPQQMRRAQTVRDLDAHRQHQLQTRRPLSNDLVQRLPRHILHHDVGFFALFADLIDGADVGVLDRRGQPRLAQHSRPHLLHRQRRPPQDLQHHGTHQLRIVGQIHDSAAARAQFPDEFVVPYHSFHVLPVYRAKLVVGRNTLENLGFEKCRSRIRINENLPLQSNSRYFTGIVSSICKSAWIRAQRSPNILPYIGAFGSA